MFYKTLIILLVLNWSSLAYGQALNLSGTSSPGAVLQYNNKPWAIPSPQKQDSGEPSNQAPTRDQAVPNTPVETEKQSPENPLSNNLFIFIQTIRLDNMTLLSSEAVEKKLNPFVTAY